MGPDDTMKAVAEKASFKNHYFKEESCAEPSRFKTCTQSRQCTFPGKGGN
jgi:hypothetical protein